MFSREEAAQRKNRRGKAEIAPRFAATATQELNCKRMAMLYGAEAAEVMMSEPERLPDWVLEGPHDASPASHKDWAIEEGGDNDPAKWDLELRLRDSRSRLIREYLPEGRTVFYKSTGSSTWPLGSLMTPAPSTQYRLQQRRTGSTRSRSRPPKFS